MVVCYQLYFLSTHYRRSADLLYNDCLDCFMQSHNTKFDREEVGNLFQYPLKIDETDISLLPWERIDLDKIYI